MKLDIRSWLNQTRQDDSEAKPSRVQTIEVLNNRRRRFAVYYLKQRPDAVVEMWDLAAQVAAWEEGIERADVTYKQQKRVHSSLYQYHAPQLADAGLIEYSQADGTVRLTDHGQTVSIYQRTPRMHVAPWAVCFLSISTLGAVIIVTDVAFMYALLRVPLTVGKVVLAVGLLLVSVGFATRAQTMSTTQPTGPPPECPATETQPRADDD